jgi:hypothetical protein
MSCAFFALMIPIALIKPSTAEEGGKRYSLEEVLALAERRNPSLSVFQANVRTDLRARVSQS